MSKIVVTFAVLIVFVAFAGFGLFAPLASHMAHDANCVFASGEMALCAAPLAHLKQWQDALVTILIEVLLFGIAWVVGKSYKLFHKRDPQYERYRLQERIPIRPSLFQELYAQGILNRKEP